MILRSTAVAALLLVAGCATPSGPRPASTAAALQGDAARPGAATPWIRSELYFGVGRLDAAAPAVSEAQWRAFLDAEVTPRFPDGFTVLDAYGQWLTRGQAAPERLKSRVIVILHADTPQRLADIEAIRLAWKRATRDQSVLWSRQPVTVSF